MNKNLAAYMKSTSVMVERELRRILRHPEKPPIAYLQTIPPKLREAMEYSLMAGGKRLRPVLVMAAAESCRMPGRKVLKTACALEMIHTYSLIHDDLPAMDDDALRRGKPTNHIVYGEAVAILAGDALLTYAFEAAAENALALGLNGKRMAELVRVIAAGSGARGMVGGQAEDLESEDFPAASLKGSGRRRAQKKLHYIHTHKTAALITASLEAGAILAGAGQGDRAAFGDYGLAIGLAFQIVDDILDRVGDKKKLGKLGSDLDNSKLTFPRLYGIDGSRALAKQWTEKAHLSLKRFGPRAKPLHDLADFIYSRDR